ncbi:hypothetical protein D3C85_791420 [compost metagenome]
MAGSDERRRNPHQRFAFVWLLQLGNGGFGARGIGAAAEEVTWVQIGQVHIDIVPLVRRLADDPAGLMAHRAAFLFAEHHQAPEQRRGVTAGISDFHPAGRLATQAISRDVLIVFQGVVPKEFGIEVADAGVDLEAHHLDIDHAFEHVQTRPGAVQAGVIALWPLLADLGGVPRTGLPADACQQAPGLVQPQRLDQFAADGSECRTLQQHHTLATQPDAAVLRGERHGLGQLLGCRQATGAELACPVDEQTLLPAKHLLEELLISRATGLAGRSTSHRQSTIQEAGR